MQNRVAEGLGELSADNLAGGVERGIGDVAKRAGASDEAVRDILSSRALEEAARAVTARQREAIDAWRLHAGHIGGLLSGIAELTVDGRTPDVALCLERLAKKLSQDDELARPLTALAEVVQRFQDRVEEAARALDEEGALERAYRRRQRARWLRLTLGMLALAVAMGVLGRWQLARTRVLSAVADPDPCAVFTIADRDRWLASSGLQARVGERERDCEEIRIERLRVEQEAEREAKRREEARLTREARVTACAALAEHVADGELEPSDREVAGAAAPFLERVSRGALLPEDYGPRDIPPVPCDGNPAKAALEELITRAFLADPMQWVSADSPSPTLQKILLEHRDDLADRDKILFTERAERRAEAAVNAGLPGAIEQAAVGCSLARALGIGGRTACDAAVRLAEAQGLR